MHSRPWKMHWKSERCSFFFVHVHSPVSHDYNACKRCSCRSLQGSNERPVLCCAQKQKAVLLGSVTVKYNLRTKVISHSSLHRYPQDTVTSPNNWGEPINYPSSTFSVSLIPRPPARLHLTAVEKNQDWSAPEPWTVYICYGHDLILPVVVNEDVDISLR